MRFHSIVRPVAMAAALVVGLASSADAACTRLAFSVNDYGKEGPIRDAKSLLDKHAADWAAKNGIKKFTVGKKDVSCELYLDLIVFDEYTCKAEANVCWEGGPSKAAVDAGNVPVAGEAKKATPAKAPAAAPKPKAAAAQ
jgi:hypothetical protein